jgi:hypothetical protein
MSTSRDADSGEDEIYSEDETRPHLVTASRGWRKVDSLGAANEWMAGLDAKKPKEGVVTVTLSPIPADPIPGEYAEKAVEWHRLLSQAFNSLAKKMGKKTEVWVGGGGTGYRVEAGKCGGESWERGAVPDGTY